MHNFFQDQIINKVHRPQKKLSESSMPYSDITASKGTVARKKKGKEERRITWISKKNEIT